MKILHTADWHLGKRLFQYSRLEEQRQVLEEIAAIADAEAVDVILIAGDIFDNYNPGAEVTELLYLQLKRMSKDGARPIIAIAGNHDSPDRIAAPDPLARACGIILIGYPDTEVTPVDIHPDWKISNTAPGFIEIAWPDKPPLRIITTAFTNEIRVKQYMGQAADAGIRQYLSEHWQQLADKYMDDDGINILMAHLLVWNQHEPPPEEPEGERPILVGNASIVYASLIPKQVQYVALGHLHRHQLISGNDMPIYYCGSPLAYSFAEAQQQKYVNIIEVMPDRHLNIQPKALKSGTTLRTATLDTIESALEWVSTYADDHLQLKLAMDSYLQASDIKLLQQAAHGLLNIIPVIRHKQTNKIMQDPSADTDIHTLFLQYFMDRKGVPPDEGLIQLFNELLSSEPTADEQP